jgi:hypothetical protein
MVCANCHRHNAELIFTGATSASTERGARTERAGRFIECRPTTRRSWCRADAADEKRREESTNWHHLRNFVGPLRELSASPEVPDRTDDANWRPDVAITH